MDDNDSILILRAILRTRFAFFTQKVFQTLHPGSDYLHNWHIDAIAHALEGVRSGLDKRLLITQPPRSLKSITTSVAWVAWCLGHNPSKTFLCISYSKDLAVELSEKFRLTVQSDWYRDLFPGTRFTKLTQDDIQTDKGGRRLSTSIGGTLTGRGADIIIIDDPLKADEAASAVSRQSVIDWYSGTLMSRLNNQKKSAIIMVMQRLHEEDLAGYILRKDEVDTGVDNLKKTIRPSVSYWNHLNLPAIATEDQLIPIGRNPNNAKTIYHRRSTGDILHPEREGQFELDRLKRDLSSQRFSAQYQQDPLSLDGNLIRPHWMIRYTYTDIEIFKKQHPGQIVQSWDIATTTTNNSDWSVCTTWLKSRKDYFLLHTLRVRREFPELKKLVITHCLNWSAKVLLLEKDGIGLPLFQSLQDDHTAGVPKPIGIKAKGDKFVRMEAQSATIEAGQMHIPEDAPWMDVYLREILAFPHGKHDDQVDSTSQFLNWVSQSKPDMVNHGAIVIYADDYGFGVDPDYPPTLHSNNRY